MTRKEWMQTASFAAEEVYKYFLGVVVQDHVVKDREEIAIGEKTKRNVDAGLFIDPRTIRLISISGKGGYSSDPEKQKIYDKFFNISLLDHLLSVTRGALVLSALDFMAQNPAMELAVLKRRLFVVAVIAFMHDLDKDLDLDRNTPIEITALEERMKRYGINEFLSLSQVELSADQLRYLIEKVESTQAHRHEPDILPPRDFELLPLYVRLADKLDGAWLSSDPETGGIQGVLKRLREDKSCLRSELLKEWKEVLLFDPHHPFLLDEFQRWLSLYSIRIFGIPPLVEVHHDGYLFLLLPGQSYDDIVEKTVNSMMNWLPLNLKIDISNRGIPSLYNGQPSHADLVSFIETLSQKNLSDLFRVKRELMNSLRDLLNKMLSDISLQPNWPQKAAGALVTLYSSFANLDAMDFEHLHRAAHLVLLLNLKVKGNPKDCIPNYTERELKLLELVGMDRPDWINEIGDDASRRTVTGLWVTALAARNEEVLKKVWNEESGLLRKWLIGDGKIPGFNRFFPGDSAVIIDDLSRRLHQLLEGRRIVTSDEKAMGRCLFTNEPVPFNQTIDQALGLYGVKVSAFSGRDGRPESITSERAHTNVGYTSIVEHKLRAQVNKEQGGKDDGVATLISSPTTSGLFGGLAITDDKSMGAMSLYDLNRLEIKKGKVLKGAEMYQGRYRMARMVRIPESLKGQVNTFRMMLIASRRLGRPIHVFRGLPMLQRSFFYFDAMPKTLCDLLGGNSLRIEQIPVALKRLEIAQKLIETNGLGYDVLKMYTNRVTKFGAICLSYCYLRDGEDKATYLLIDLYKEFLTYMEGKASMDEKDGALVRFGVAAAGIQQNPGGRASTSEELLVFKLCLEAVNQARRNDQDDEKSLVYAVAGELETNLVRKQKAAAKKWRDEKNLIDGCFNVAELFVKEVWLGVLKGKAPSQKSRRVLSSIYRMAFLKTHREHSQEKTYQQPSE